MAFNSAVDAHQIRIYATSGVSWGSNEVGVIIKAAIPEFSITKWSAHDNTNKACPGSQLPHQFAFRQVDSPAFDVISSETCAIAHPSVQRLCPQLITKATVAVLKVPWDTVAPNILPLSRRGPRGDGQGYLVSQSWEGVRPPLPSVPF